MNHSQLIHAVFNGHRLGESTLVGCRPEQNKLGLDKMGSGLGRKEPDKRALGLHTIVEGHRKLSEEVHNWTLVSCWLSELHSRPLVSLLLGRHNCPWVSWLLGLHKNVGELRTTLAGLHMIVEGLRTTVRGSRKIGCTA